MYYAITAALAFCCGVVASIVTLYMLGAEWIGAPSERHRLRIRHYILRDKDQYGIFVSEENGLTPPGGPMARAEKHADALTICNALDEIRNRGLVPSAG